MRDDNIQQDKKYGIEIIKQLNKKLSAMSDDEFFTLLESLDNKQEENKYGK